MLVLTSRLLHQQPKDRGKLYSLHEPEVDCISKGKARVRYEFGTKVSVAATIGEGFIVGMRALPGNPYDGHTLAEALEQVEVLTDRRPSARRRRPRLPRARRRDHPRADQRHPQGAHAERSPGCCVAAAPSNRRSAT